MTMSQDGELTPSAPVRSWLRIGLTVAGVSAGAWLAAMAMGSAAASAAPSDSSGGLVGVLTNVTSVADAVVTPVADAVVAPLAETVVAPVAQTVLSPVIDTAVVPIVDTVVVPVATPIVEAVAPLTTPILAPIIENIAAPLLVPVVQAAAPILAPVVSAAAPILTPVLTPVVDALSPALSPVVQTLDPVIRPITEPLSPIIDPVLGPPSNNGDNAGAVIAPSGAAPSGLTSSTDAPMTPPDAIQAMGTSAATSAFTASPRFLSAGPDSSTSATAATLEVLPQLPSLPSPAPLSGLFDFAVPSGGMASSGGASILLAGTLADRAMPELRFLGTQNTLDDVLPTSTVIDFLRLPG